MSRPGVAGQALDLPLERRRIRFQVSPMARRRSNGLPGFFGGSFNVALFAGTARNRGVGRDLLTANSGHPEDELHRFLHWLQRMTGVAAEGVVLAFEVGDQGVIPGIGVFPGLPAGDKDVAPIAEAAVGLDEVVALVAETDCQQNNETYDTQ